MSKDAKLVYSTDPALNRKCPKCKNLLPECECPREAGPASSFSARLRIETNNRGGKVVTVIDKLPRSEKFLSELARELKNRCGSGGTHRIEEDGIVEIQGDKREIIRAILKQKKIDFKG